MKKLLMCGTLATVIFFSFSPLRAGDMPSADAAKVWSYITETNPYLGWGFWPGYPEIYPGKSPHGKFLKLYANAQALKAAREGQPMPDGAIIVSRAADGTTLEWHALTGAPHQQRASTRALTAAPTGDRRGSAGRRPVGPPGCGGRCR